VLVHRKLSGACAAETAARLALSCAGHPETVGLCSGSCDTPFFVRCAPFASEENEDMAAKKKKSASAVQPAPVQSPDDDALIGPYRAAAQALERFDVVGIDSRLSLHNARLGAHSVLAEEARVRRELPDVDVAQIKSLEGLALAYDAAARRVDRSSKKNVGPRYARAAELRRIVLSNALSLAAAGVLDAARVRRIEQGKGKLDAARDCVDLAELYRAEAAAVRGKTPVTAAQLAEMEQLGTELTTLLAPKGARKRLGDEAAQALELRNRIGTLMLAAWDSTWRTGAYLFGPNGVDSAVPLLLSRKRVASKAKKPE
jgi:hypothetical protein